MRPLEAVEQLLLDAAERGRVDADRAEGLVASLLGTIRTATPAEAVAIAASRGAARYLPEHTWNVTRLALYSAAQADWPDAELALLGMAALWHDAGMLTVPPWRWLQERILDPDDLREVQGHAEAGAAIVAGAGAWPDRVARIVAQVHERHDGSGYPAGLAGDAIDPCAALLAVCDTYEALVSPRLYRRPFPPAEAMRAVLAEAEAERFCPDATRTFVAAIGLYPVGSAVWLADGRQGWVVAANRDQPGRPVLALTAAADGQTIAPPQTLDLAEHPAVQIAG